MMEWQPIETAPKDEYILLHEDGATRCGMWESGKWTPAEIPVLVDPVGNRMVPREVAELKPGYSLELSWFLYEPTHWMPLPDSPKDA